MATMETISAALKLIDVKKENLRNAFEGLQSHSSSLSSFPLTWSDLDSHFTSLQSALEHKFILLQTLEPQSQPPPPLPSPTQPSSSSLVAKNSGGDSVPVPARPELKSFCEKMDGLGLRRYLVERPKERTAIRAELADALRSAPDAAALVLDAMEGFYSSNSKSDKDWDLSSLRGACTVLLEELMKLKLEIGSEVKEKARNLAVEWKGKMSADGENQFEPLGFLHLLATYGLVGDFSKDDLIDYVVLVARYRQTMDLCRVLDFGERIYDLVQKLISNGKQLLAVKFIFKFELTDKFPPVPILKAHVKESKKLAQKVRKGGKFSRTALNDAAMKEVGALKSVIKFIEDYNLDSEYPKEILLKRIENLEKEIADRKRSAAVPAPKPQQKSKPKKQNGSKRPRMTAPDSPPTIQKSVAANSNFPSIQQPHPQMAGLLPDRPASYMSSPVGPYGLAGSTPAVAPYAGSSAGLYGFPGDPLGFPGNLTPAGSNLYPSEPYMPSGYYDRPIAYGGYGLPPQYHPSYYPQ